MEYEPTYLEKIKKVTIDFSDDFYSAILDKIGDAQIVLLGEATHGTQEFYDIRSKITQKLILEKGFNAIAIEGDWPEAHNVNHYINHFKFNNAQEALKGFNRFPTWMWQNFSIVNLVEWLHEYNKSALSRVNFYGLDLYSLYGSIDAIITYLEKVDPDAAHAAKKRYACLEQFRQDPQVYGYSVFTGLSESCKQEVIDVLKSLQESQWRLVLENKVSASDAFYVIQNARLVKNAEEYYRSLFINEVSNWNLRDTHMMETLEQIVHYHHNLGVKNPKIVIWAHNSHIGNSAATQMGMQGEFNIGHLVKDTFSAQSYSLGFTTYNGTVTAASDWHKPVERKRIRNALDGSYEALFHALGKNTFFLSLEDKTLVPGKMLERAIGVVYAPQTERQSHYFYASLAHQFDGVIHYDRTTALEPLEKTTQWIDGEVPETYPTGL